MINSYKWKKGRKCKMYVWESKEGLYYYVSGNIEAEELLRIMMGIQEGDKK